MHIKALSVNNTKISYIDEGNGPVIVFLHGTFLDKMQWEHQIAALSASFRVIGIDLRGHGESGAAFVHYSATVIREDVLSLLNSIDVFECTICGHSLGGLVARSIALVYPHRIRGLVLTGVLSHRTSTFTDTILSGFPALFVYVHSVQYEKKLTAADTIYHNRETRSYVSSQLKNVKRNPLNYYRIWQAYSRFEAESDCSGISTPVLILSGEACREAMQKASEMRDRLAGSTMHSIPSAGCIVALDNPSAVTDEIRGFMDIRDTD